MEKAKQIRDGVVLAGDGRHDSMGHSAKYCAYTMFCCTLGLIVHFSLVQVEINSKMYLAVHKCEIKLLYISMHPTLCCCV